MRRRLIFAGIVAAIAAETIVVARRRGTLVDPRTVVRCRDGHLFSTLWIPAASLKALRLGWWRLQRCPVGPHWSLVTPVKVSELSAEQRRTAAEQSDLPIP